MRHTEIQSIGFPKRLFTLAKAERWIKKHGFKIKTIEITTHFYHFRQFEPNRKKKFRTEKLPNGVEFTYQIND